MREVRMERYWPDIGRTLIGGSPWAAELETACDSLGLGRRRADWAEASMRGARRKFSKLKTDSMVLGGKFGMTDDILGRVGAGEMFSEDTGVVDNEMKEDI
jgi:hypothetical protein